MDEHQKSVRSVMNRATGSAYAGTPPPGTNRLPKMPLKKANFFQLQLFKRGGRGDLTESLLHMLTATFVKMQINC